MLPNVMAVPSGELAGAPVIVGVGATLVTVIVTVVLIEMITRAGKRKDEVSTRTDLMASITSGLAFALLTNLGLYAWSYVQKVLGH